MTGSVQGPRAAFRKAGLRWLIDHLEQARRLLHGCEIESLHVDYTERERFDLRVVLRTPYGEVGGKPLLDGFYSFARHA